MTWRFSSDPDWMRNAACARSGGDQSFVVRGAGVSRFLPCHATRAWSRSSAPIGELSRARGLGSGAERRHISSNMGGTVGRTDVVSNAVRYDRPFDHAQAAIPTRLATPSF